ncbi:GntR family transcriptional regulator [Longispora fulva]|uniref:GntR family transcriptional regulator/MocR family aminotransferase n=1 Tax=Longispora fulva TaxID=619741 RepID=A0A8J7KRP3_9ACTN|nr:PLP-dependent aminotransferase family protein [Longispora fulva]MBG6138732.1 GntR family transcriptional regulator/MocR family aminotransferase [Longispora fulva]GIG58226.1 GntR family transcriptional regulator [Longispora fulva]
MGQSVDFHVTLAGRGDLTARIYRQLLDAILDGRLRTGERLPPTRELAASLEVSRNTVAAAYDQLTAEGFLVGRVGAGTFVADESVTRVAARRASRHAPPGRSLRPRRLWSTIPVPAPPGPPPEFDFRVGMPDRGLFPAGEWRRLVSAELRTVPPAAYADPAGHPGLRAAIARHVGVSRSVRAGADDVLVTQGAQQALDLVGRVLLEPGGCVAVEEPGYPPARRLFGSLGARVVGVPVDAEGLVVDAIPPEARLVYVTPSHQFPLGTPMSPGRRAALLGWAELHRTVIVEDDYDSEFRYSDRPLEPLQSLDSAGRVIYVGSFSKTMLPALRLGFLIAPASLHDALRTAKQLTDWHGDLYAQGAMARFIEDGSLARHIRRASREYGQRRERIIAAVADRFELVPSAAGLHLCARSGPEAGEIMARAAAVGVAVESLANYCGDAPQHGLVIGWGAVSRVEEGLRRLRECF